MRDTFEFTYKPSYADALVGVRMGFFGSPRRIARSSVLLFLLPFGLGFLVSGGLAPEMSIGTAVIASGVFAAFWGVAFSFAFSRWIARRVVAQELARASSYTITVSPAGVATEAGATTRTLSWSGVTNIREQAVGFLLLDGERLVGSISRSSVPPGELADLRTFLGSIKPLAQDGRVP